MSVGKDGEMEGRQERELGMENLNPYDAWSR